MAARRYHQPVADAERVAHCESTDNPSADNGHGDLGLFQILYPSTWDANGNPWRRHSPFSARYSSLTAMWMWARGERGQWQCS